MYFNHDMCLSSILLCLRYCASGVIYRIQYNLWCVMGLCSADFCIPLTIMQWFVCWIYPAVSKLCVVVFHAAAAPGSPAVSAPGPGPAHDPSAAGPEPANPPCRYHLLRALLPLLPAGLPSPAGQGGESITWRSWQPPRGGRRQVWLDGVPIQLCFYPETWIPRSEPPFGLQHLPWFPYLWP